MNNGGFTGQQPRLMANRQRLVLSRRQVLLSRRPLVGNGVWTGTHQPLLGSLRAVAQGPPDPGACAEGAVLRQTNSTDPLTATPSPIRAGSRTLRPPTPYTRCPRAP